MVISINFYPIILQYKQQITIKLSHFQNENLKNISGCSRIVVFYLLALINHSIGLWQLPHFSLHMIHRSCCVIFTLQRSQTYFCSQTFHVYFVYNTSLGIRYKLPKCSISIYLCISYDQKPILIKDIKIDNITIYH